MKRTALVRRTPLRSVNAKRRRKRLQEAFGPKADWVRGLPCCLCGNPPPSHPHHTTSRGRDPLNNDVVPLCADCHRRVHAGLLVNPKHLTRHYATQWETERNER